MTTIHVKEDTWKKLNGLKKPGETMDDVIQKILEISSEVIEIDSASSKVEDGAFDKLLDEFCSIADEDFSEISKGLRKSFQKSIRD